GGGLDQSERRQIGDAPAVNNLSAERDLVVALQVAVAVRVAVTDHLKADLLLHTPADGREVAHDAENVGGGLGNAVRANGLRDGDAVALKLRGVGAVGKSRVNLPPVRVALLRELHRERRIERGIGGDVARAEDKRVSGIKREVRGRTVSSLNRIGGRELLRHRRNRSASARVDAVNHAIVESARKRGLNLSKHLLDNPEAVILLGPGNLIRHADGLLELERLDS